MIPIFSNKDLLVESNLRAHQIIEILKRQISLGNLRVKDYQELIKLVGNKNSENKEVISGLAKGLVCYPAAILAIYDNDLNLETKIDYLSSFAEYKNFENVRTFSIKNKYWERFFNDLQSVTRPWGLKYGDKYYSAWHRLFSSDLVITIPNEILLFYIEKCNNFARCSSMRVVKELFRRDYFKDFKAREYWYKHGLDNSSFMQTTLKHNTEKERINTWYYGSGSAKAYVQFLLNWMFQYLEEADLPYLQRLVNHTYRLSGNSPHYRLISVYGEWQGAEYLFSRVFEKKLEDKVRYFYEFLSYSSPKHRAVAQGLSPDNKYSAIEFSARLKNFCIKNNRLDYYNSIINCAKLDTKDIDQRIDQLNQYNLLIQSKK